MKKIRKIIEKAAIKSVKRGKRNVVCMENRDPKSISE